MRFPALSRPVKAFFAADILVSIPYVVNRLVGQPFAKINRLVDLDDEANLPSWYSSMQWAVVAGLLAFVAYRQRKRGAASAIPLAITSAIFMALSLDEIAQVHEKLSIGVSGKVGQGQGEFKTLWLPALGIPVLIVIGVAARRAKAAFDAVPGALQAFGIGLLVFALGAFGIEPVVSLGIHAKLGPAFVWLEETMEMLGVTFILWGAFALATSEGLLAFEDRAGPTA
ncbi:MAG: hypothetical protein IT361_13625 [Gemmatimonadaceae bacterium]|nr:hypothetical protein [Gemmatimonadaceae bacterium]